MIITCRVGRIDEEISQTPSLVLPRKQRKQKAKTKPKTKGYCKKVFGLFIHHSYQPDHVCIVFSSNQPIIMSELTNCYADDWLTKTYVAIGCLSKKTIHT